jgi:hypothetical protein
VTTPPESPAPRRRPFAAIRKGIVEHVLSGRFNATQLGVYVWLHLTADHETGTVWTSAPRLATELKLHPSTVREILASLRQAGYLGYECVQGQRALYEITIEKYHAQFEDGGREVRRQVGRQVRRQVRLHVRRASSGQDSENQAPKKKEGRRNQKTPLRVRFADPDRSDRDLLLRSETRGRAREDVPARAEGPATGDARSATDTLTREDVPACAPADTQAREDTSGQALAGTVTREDALAQAPAALRDTLELFWLKTGRDTITPSEVDALRALEAAHTPAVIQRAITKAVDRFTRRGEPAAALTLDYIQQSLQHFTTRARTGARREAVPQPSYPVGVTRLW